MGFLVRRSWLAKLEKEWERRHGIYKHENADPIPGRRSREARHVYQPKPCARIGFCVCELPGRAAFCLWQKLSQKLRTCFPDKSSAKAKLDAGMVVLMFDVPELDDAHPKSRVWFHLGYINKKTYHFTLLRMAERGPQIGDIQPLKLAGSQEGFETDTSVFGLAIHVFSTLFELEGPLSVTVCFLLQRQARFLHLSEMEPHHVDVHVSSGTPDFMWRGWELEKPQPRKRKRKDQGQGKKEEQEDLAPKSGSRGPRVKKSRSDAAIEPIEDQPDQGRAWEYSPSIAPAGSDSDHDDDNDYDDPVQEDLDMDLLFASDDDDDDINIVDFGDAEEDPVLQEAGEMLDEVNLVELDIGELQEPSVSDIRGPGPDHAVPSANTANQDDSAEIVPTDLMARFDATNTHETSAPENIALAGDTAGHAVAGDKTVHGADVDKKSADQTQEDRERSSSLCTDDMSISELSVHHSDDDSCSSSSSNGSDDSNLPGPSAGNPKKESRKPVVFAGPRAPKIVDDRFDIPNVGSIRFNVKSSSMVAFCPFHTGHCRRTRTCKASTRNQDQGRPLGVLMAWLEAGPDFEDQQSHSSECRPSFEARVSARSDFVALDGGQAFSDLHERPLAPGEASEPRNAS